MLMKKLRLGCVCAFFCLFVSGCATMAQNKAYWDVSGSLNIKNTVGRTSGGGMPPSIDFNTRDTCLIFTFKNKQNEIIKGIRIAKVELYKDGTRVEEMPAAEFKPKTSWNGTVTPQKTEEMTYCRTDNPKLDDELKGKFHAVVIVEAAEDISAVVTTKPVDASHETAMRFMALPKN